MRAGPGALTLMLAAATAGCTMVGRSASPTSAAPPAAPSPWSATYGGTVVLGGQSLPAVLRLSGPGDRIVEGELRIDPLDLTARGRGTRDRASLSLELAYAGECPGKIELAARPGDREGTLDGTLVANDCTGSEKGTVRLVQRTTGGPRQDPR
jgi:hypothetical protein